MNVPARSMTPRQRLDAQLVDYVRAMGSAQTVQVACKFGLDVKDCRTQLSRLKREGKLNRISAPVYAADDDEHSFAYMSTWQAVPQ